MSNYYTDGIDLHFHDGRVLPLEPSARIVLHQLAVDHLHGYLNSYGEVMVHQLGSSSKVIEAGDPGYVSEVANHYLSYFGPGQDVYRSIEVKPRGSRESLLFYSAEVSGLAPHKVNINSNGLLATLSNNRQAFIESNQTIVFYNCKPELVSSRMSEYRKTGASWSNPVVANVAFNGSPESASQVSNLLRGNNVLAVQLKFAGSQPLIYPKGYITWVNPT